ncbi:MAG: nucleotidyltransferase family protein [Ferruginibacter sp.]|nr:nucleotidyltransferase family protein [Ferruginibacter sp.]
MSEVSENKTFVCPPFIGCECIILAGGLGTRLRSAVPDLPKCMAPVAGKPFLHFVIQYLQQQGVNKFVFSLGYMHEIVGNWLLKNYPILNYQLSIEDEPLGTGGAIQLALKMATTKHVLVLNGDTMFKIDVSKLFTFHEQKKAACTLALKPMHDFDRYGVVEINKEDCIKSFKEKKYYKEGLINGGVYVLDAVQFLAIGLPEKFSFEKDYLEKYVETIKMIGQVQDGYFIDIGIPEDLEKANKQFEN